MYLLKIKKLFQHCGKYLKKNLNLGHNFQKSRFAPSFYVAGNEQYSSIGPLWAFLTERVGVLLKMNLTFDHLVIEWY